MKRWKIAGINFDHQHMGDLLQHVADHPEAEIVGIAHEDRIKMQGVVDTLAITEAHVFTDYQQCLEQTEPDLVILCPATASHADWTEKVAPYGVHVLVEKPFAASVTDAQRMIRALEQTGQQLVINWPLRWYPPHVTSKRLIDEGTIGDVTEVHYYDGNCGPVRHGANKMELEPSAETKAASWFYAKDQGGGSLLDYLGYGVTLGSWFNGGLEPLDVTTIVDKPEGLEVDEHSVSIVRYPTGLSKFETRWGTFSDPWTHQPQPKCGFVMVGTKGTLASYDYELSVRLQTRSHPHGKDIPVDTLMPPCRNPIEYTLHCLDNNIPITGPLSPALCLLGQRIVDAAYTSAQENRTVAF